MHSAQNWPLSVRKLKTALGSKHFHSSALKRHFPYEIDTPGKLYARIALAVSPTGWDTILTQLNMKKGTYCFCLNCPDCEDEEWTTGWTGQLKVQLAGFKFYAVPCDVSCVIVNQERCIYFLANQSGSCLIFNIQRVNNV